MESNRVLIILYKHFFAVRIKIAKMKIKLPIVKYFNADFRKQIFFKIYLLISYTINKQYFHERSYVNKNTSKIKCKSNGNPNKVASL